MSTAAAHSVGGPEGAVLAAVGAGTAAPSPVATGATRALAVLAVAAFGGGAAAAALELVSDAAVPNVPADGAVAVPGTIGGVPARSTVRATAAPMSSFAVTPSASDQVVTVLRVVPFDPYTVGA